MEVSSEGEKVRVKRLMMGGESIPRELERETIMDPR